MRVEPQQLKAFLKPKLFLAFAAIGGLAFLSGGFFHANPPLFQNTDNFVLFGSEEVKPEQEVQISSGDIGSNKEINIDKDAIISGNLFSDKIIIDKNTTVNGNASFNKLIIKKESQILGTQTKSVQLPIANLPEIPEFQTGTQDFRFQGQNNTLSSGNYGNIILEKDSRLILEGGVYNLNKLELKENSTLIFNAPATINIKDELKARQKVSIFSGQNTTFNALRINYEGEKPVEFGKNSFLNLKLLAPKANVYVGKESTLRGQVLARKIRIGKDSILSREEGFVYESDPEKTIIDTDGSEYVINEIMVNFSDNATFIDAQVIAGLVGGRIVGFVESANAFQIEITVNTADELSAKIQAIRQSNNPLVEGIFRSYILKLISL